MMSIRTHLISTFLLILVLALTAGCASDASSANAGAPDGVEAAGAVITVYKTLACGCCKAWVEYMRQAGFTVETQDLSDLSPIKTQYGVSPSMQSCHTAVVDGYVIEGHVPAADVERLLAERPDVAGLAVPGMPAGSPGMEVPGRAADPFDVLAFTESGEVELFASYR